MITWFSTSLGDGIVASAPLARIEKAFLPMYAQAGNPVDMAVFTRHVTEGDLHCDVIAYFSPAAASVAVIFGAEPCHRPAREGIDLLVGDKRCWSVLFPGSER